MAIQGNAAKGHAELYSIWCEKGSAARRAAAIQSMSDDEVKEVLANIDTARVHAASVFRTIQKLRPEITFP